MAGYNGYSMSNNAVAAYNEGVYPLTIAVKELSKAFNITQKKARSILEKVGPCEYHHTSKYYNKTDFYDVNGIINEQSIHDELSNLLGNNYESIIQTARKDHSLNEDEVIIRNIIGDELYNKIGVYGWVHAHNHLGV